MYNAHRRSFHLWVRSTAKRLERLEHEDEVRVPLARQQRLHHDLCVVLLVHNDYQREEVLVPGARMMITKRAQTGQARRAHMTTLLTASGNRCSRDFNKRSTSKTCPHWFVTCPTQRRRSGKPVLRKPTLGAPGPFNFVVTPKNILTGSC